MYASNGATPVGEAVLQDVTQAVSFAAHAPTQVAYVPHAGSELHACVSDRHGPWSAHVTHGEVVLHVPVASTQVPPLPDEEAPVAAEPVEEAELVEKPEPVDAPDCAKLPVDVAAPPAPVKPLPLLPLPALDDVTPPVGGVWQRFVAVSHHAPFKQPLAWHPDSVDVHETQFAGTFGPTTKPQTSPPLAVELAWVTPVPTLVESSPPLPSRLETTFVGDEQEARMAALRTAIERPRMDSPVVKEEVPSRARASQICRHERMIHSAHGRIAGSLVLRRHRAKPCSVRE
jgi:hypothetical protein